MLRPHAEGGLGEVFVAEDQELHREVALKEIKREHAQRDSRSRFLLEAEITGGLEHPGIVPVYGLGTYGDGRPFYAMRFIKGDNLKAAIQRFHLRSRFGFDSLDFRATSGTICGCLPGGGICAQPRGAAPGPEAGQHHAGKIR